MIDGLGQSSAPPTFKAPTSSHRDAQWYRTAGKKTDENTPEPLGDDAVIGDIAWSAFSLIASGIILYGGVGWLIGRWVGNESLFAAAGVLVGVALATFMIYRRLGSRDARRKD